MKVYISNEQLKQMQIASHGTKLYGQIRPEEGLAHIVYVGKHEFPVKEIGIISTKESKNISKDNRIITAVIKRKEITIFYSDGEYKQAKLIVLKESDIFKRTPFDTDSLYVLKESIVVVFGAGTGGSYIAKELARAGVGELRLCEYDLFKIENSSRHEGGFTDIGRFKTRVTGEQVWNINPNIKLRFYEDDLLDGTKDDKLNECLNGCSLVVSSMDRTESSLYLNRKVWQLGIPAVYGGCYEEALGGEVFFTLPENNTPCLECLRGGLKQPEQIGEIDYSIASGPENYMGEPGLHAAINLVSSIEVQVILGLLLRNTKSKLKELANPNKNFLLIGGALSKGFYLFNKPFHIFYQPLIGPRKDCDTHRLSKESERNSHLEIIHEVPGEYHKYI